MLINQGQSPLTAWNANPTTTLLLLAVAYLYVTGLRRWSNPSYHISLWRKASFFSGLFAIFLALQSPIDPHWPTICPRSTRCSTCCCV